MKTPQSPGPSTPPASPPRKPLKSGSAKTLLCAAGLTAAACASVPVRPTQQQCPREAIKAMEQREWDKFDLFLKPEVTKPGATVTLRPGPIISAGYPSPISDLRGKALLHGHVYFAEDGRVVVHYTEVELENEERVPICFSIRRNDGKADLWDIVGRTEESVTVNSDQIAVSFRVLPD